MGNRLAGKTILVTAAAQGMGRAAALAMAREGATVHATDIRDDLLATLADEARIAGHPLRTHHLDVTDAAAIDALIGALPVLDVLFNCAGYVHQGSIFDCTEDDWDFSFTINVRSMYRTIRAAPSAVGKITLKIPTSRSSSSRVPNLRRRRMVRSRS